jgi:hypothetical protein
MTLSREGLQKIQEIEKQMQDEIKKVTGAVVEVILRWEDKMTVYTEDLERAADVKELMSAARDFISQDEYPADEDCPAAVNMTFTL